MSFAREGRYSGVRGGKSQFNWDDVKNGRNNDRDSFIGACMKASVNGRRDKDRDFFWYNKATDTLGRSLGDTPEQAKARRRLEILERKRADALGLEDALGETAETRRRADALDLEVGELKALLERGSTERDQLLIAERVAGLGAAPARRHDAHATSATVAAADAALVADGQQRELLASYAATRTCAPVDAAAPTNDGGGFVAADGGAAPPPCKRSRDDRDERKAAKKVRKAERKERKTAKKDRKAERKEAKKARREPSDRPRATDFM